MDNLKKEIHLKTSSEVLKVSLSGFYRWKKSSKKREERQSKKMKLVRAIEDIHRSSNKTYGSPRIYEALKALGYKCSKSQVERLMREFNIKSKLRRKFKITTTDSNHKFPIAPNLVAQNFKAEKENKLWVSDITYVWTEEGWLFLAVVLDVFSRTIVGWSMERHLKTELCLNALRMAFFRRKIRRGAQLTHHSDRGVQYAAKEYQSVLKQYGITCSMSRKANCYDNAMAESFFHTLKTEFIYHENFQTIEEAKTKIFSWIEGFYNRTRLHSSLGYKSPLQFEENQKKLKKAIANYATTN